MNDNSTGISKSEWERQIIAQMSISAELTTSDAQGVFEAHSFKVAQLWGKATSPALASLILLTQ